MSLKLWANGGIIVDVNCPISKQSLQTTHALLRPIGPHQCSEGTCKKLALHHMPGWPTLAETVHQNLCYFFCAEKEKVLDISAADHAHRHDDSRRSSWKFDITPSLKPLAFSAFNVGAASSKAALKPGFKPHSRNTRKNISSDGRHH